MLLPLDGGLRPAQRTQPVAATAPQDFEQRIDRARNDQRGSGGAGSDPIQQDKNVTEAIRLTRQAQDFDGAQNVPAAERGMELRARARSLLTPGFVQAGLPVAHDERALTSALNGHERQLTASGRNTPGFDEAVADTKQNVSRDLNELFGPLRPPIAEARRTGNWSGVQRAVERQLDTLTRGSSDPDTAVNGLSRIMLAGGPRREAVVIPGYQQVIEGAKHTILVERPAQQIIDAAALNQHGGVRQPGAPGVDQQIPPALTMAEQVTRDTPDHAVSPERAAQILSVPGVQNALSGAIQDLSEPENLLVGRQIVRII